MHKSGVSWPAPVPAAYELALAERVRRCSLSGGAELGVLLQTVVVRRCRLNR